MKVCRNVSTAEQSLKGALLCLMVASGLTACGNPPYPRGSTEQLFAGSASPTMSLKVVSGQRIYMANMPSDTKSGEKNGSAGTKKILLFVHGSPGDWKAWSYYLKTPELAGFANRIAIDRPGFGDSGRGVVMTDLRQQAALIAALIPEGQKAIVVGHSLGGPLAVWMALNSPDKVCGVISIAGSLSSRYEEPRWYNLLADSVLVRWAVPAEMIWSNKEMMTLSGELGKLEAAVGQLRIPVTLIQGAKDSLVEPETVDEFAKRAPAAWLKIKNLPNETHFVLWEKPQIIVDAIKEMPCASSP
jgi:pimeloyl-ACP methyl ester carboxylesterase